MLFELHKPSINSDFGYLSRTNNRAFYYSVNKNFRKSRVVIHVKSNFLQYL